MANRKVNDGFRFADQREALQTFVNMCFVDCQLQSNTGTNSGILGALVNITYTIGGYVYSAALPSGLYSAPTQASGTVCYYAITINSAGSLSCVKGVEAVHSDSASASVYLPNIPASLCMIGWCRLSLASTMSYHFGSSPTVASLGQSASKVSITIEKGAVAMIPQNLIMS